MQNSQEVEKVEMVYLDDGFDKMRENFLNKEVNIFPGDTLSKSGVVIDINPQGVTFHITKSHSDDYLIGQIYFINLNKLIISC